MNKIHLLKPFINATTTNGVITAIESGWITTHGPQKEQFELLLKDKFGFSHATALNSGTAGLHLSLASLGIGIGDRVIVSDVSFCAVANVVRYQGAEPILIDSEYDSWGIDPDLLEEYLKQNHHVAIKALVLVHLYGRPANIQRIQSICENYNLVLIEDAAEALGSRVNGQYCGSIGDFGVISFNGNKIITTGGGGLLISKSADLLSKCKYLANQAKSTEHKHYWHEQIGFNYGMSNISAGVGLGQLSSFDDILKSKKSIYNYYENQIRSLNVFEEISYNNELKTTNHWLSTFLFRKEVYHLLNWNDLLSYFEELHIEVRRFWTPLHIQPAYDQFENVINGTGIDLFNRGICLPSSAGMNEEDQVRVIQALKNYLLSRRFF